MQPHPMTSSSPDVARQAHALALRAAGTAWLLGAGASAQSGVPTAGQLVDRLLTELYARENNMTVAEVEARPDWVSLARRAYDGRNGLPALADVAMYSAVFDRVFPDRDIRARWLEGMLDGRRPHSGHHALAAMMAAGTAPFVVTTNFDSLIEDAYAGLRAEVDDLPRLTVLAPQSSSNTDYAVATDKVPLVVKIHGDLGTVTPMNTVGELSVGDDVLREAVRSKLSRYGLVVAGYSGRDQAVMGMLRQVLEGATPFLNGLTWVRRPEDEPAAAVTALLDAARARGVSPVEEIVVGSFGELMTHVRRAVSLPDPVAAHIDRVSPRAVRRPASRPSPVLDSTVMPQLHLCAAEILSAPDRAGVLELPSDVTADQVRTALRRAHARASVAKLGNRWLYLGRDADVREALGALGAVLTDTTMSLDASDSTLSQGLLAEAAALACGHVRGLSPVLRSRRGHQVRVATPRPGAQRSQAAAVLAKAAGAPVTGTRAVNGTRLPWAEAVTVSFVPVCERWHLMLTPDIWVQPAGKDPVQRDSARAAAQEFTRERLATRYTSKTGQLLRAWLSLLSGAPMPVWDVPERAGRAASFTLASTPLISAFAPDAARTANGGSR